MKKFLLLFLTFIALNVTGQDNDYFKIKEGSFKHISMAVWDDNKEDHRDIDNKLYTLGETWQVVIIVMVINIALAYACLKLYDEPIRKRLSKKI